MYEEIRKSIGEEKAIKLYDSNWWEDKTHREIAIFQKFALNYEGLGKELFEGQAPSSFEEIVNFIPDYFVY